jgi:hypothetical protein
MSTWHIAQINVGRTIDDLSSPAMAGFVARLDEINALADLAPGFVWRLQTGSGNATDIKPTDDPRFIVNMSVWRDVEALFTFVYKTAHRDLMATRRDWFERPDGAYQVLWWISAGTLPTVDEGLARLTQLRAEGPTQAAFTFRTVFASPEAAVTRDMEPEPFCVGWS